MSKRLSHVPVCNVFIVDQTPDYVKGFQPCKGPPESSGEPPKIPWGPGPHGRHGPHMALRAATPLILGMSLVRTKMNITFTQQYNSVFMGIIQRRRNELQWY